MTPSEKAAYIAGMKRVQRLVELAEMAAIERHADAAKYGSAPTELIMYRDGIRVGLQMASQDIAIDIRRASRTSTTGKRPESRKK